MAGLALKAISYGAERIPDRFFESIPGGYFKSQEEKEEKKRRKREKERTKRRAQSEGRDRRRRSPSATDSDYYTEDYHTEDSDSERRRRTRRSSDAGRGHDRGRDRDRKHRHHHHHKDRSWTRGQDFRESPPYASRVAPLGGQQHPYIPPPPVQPAAAFPPAHVASENYAHPQPYNAAHNHYTAKPYNPADYAPGATHTPEYSNGQSAPVNPHVPAQAPPAGQAMAPGYYGTQFPPPPVGSRSSRASSVDSRGLQSGPYIPHSNVQAIPPATAVAGPPGHSPYGGTFPPTTDTPPFGHTPPQYLPKNSSPYQPNYSPSYAPQQHMAQNSQPVSRQGSVHSGSVHNGSAHGGQVGDHRRTHDRHRRHSIATNQDPRMLPYHHHRSPYRSAAASSANSATNSLRGSFAEAIHEVNHQADGIDDSSRAVAIIVPAENADTVIGAASEGFNTAQALKSRHQARSGRRFHGSRCAAKSAPVDGYESY